MNLEMINHFNVILVISREYIVYILLVISCNEGLFFSCFHQKIVVSRKRLSCYFHSQKRSSVDGIYVTWRVHFLEQVVGVVGHQFDKSFLTKV